MPPPWTFAAVCGKAGCGAMPHFWRRRKERERDGKQKLRSTSLDHSSELCQHFAHQQPEGEKAEPAKAEARAPMSKARRVGICHVI